jgi:hypothetical protein
MNSKDIVLYDGRIYNFLEDCYNTLPTKIKKNLKKYTINITACELSPRQYEYTGEYKLIKMEGYIITLEVTKTIHIQGDEEDIKRGSMIKFEWDDFSVEDDEGSYVSIDREFNKILKDSKERYEKRKEEWRLLDEKRKMEKKIEQAKELLEENGYEIILKQNETHNEFYKITKAK